MTICPNPSIDCTVELQSLDVGKVNRIDSKILTYNGKALNVATGVARLKKDALATGFMFSADRGQFESSLKNEGVKTDFVLTEGRVRINYKIIDKRSMMTELNDKGERVPADKQGELLDKAARLAQKADITVMSGSLPQGVPEDYYSELCRAMPKNTKIFIDTEGEKLKKAVAEGVYLIKPNLHEFQAAIGRSVENAAQLIEGCREFIELGAKYVLLSLGGKGAVLTDGTVHLYCKSANVAVNSTVGAGDAMLAAAAVAVSENQPPEEVLRRAVAAGTAAITTPGTNLFYKEKYEEIYSRIYTADLKSVL